MDAGKLNIKQLFQKDVRYIIPTFQRPYVWEQEKQWEPLWEDVRNLAERYAEALVESDNQEAVAEEKTGTHFLGAIVLQQISTPAVEIERRDVIDGQQRMLTLQILLDAVQDVIEKEEFKRDARQLSRLVLNDEDFVEGDDIFKIWPTSGDRDAFRAAMTNGHTLEGYEDSKVVQAHEFFSLQVKEWLRTPDEEERTRKVRSLSTALIGLIEVVVIDLKTNDDAYVIFETLNARGTPLLASDLIKNYLLQTASSKGMDTDKIYENHWKDFEDKWWREDIRQGRLVRPRIDIFLNYWLVARKQEEVQSHEIFPSFRNYVEEAGSGFMDIVKDIQHVGETYRQLDSFDPYSTEGTFLYRWEIMQAGVVTPLLLQLFSANKNQLSQERKELCIKALESYLVRRMICRMTTKDYNRLFLELIPKVNKNIQIADEVIIKHLKSQTSESRLWPSNDDVEKAVLDLPLYRLLTRGRFRFVLEALEEINRTGKAEEAHTPRGSLTIEHILPQSWQDNWPITDEDNPQEYLKRVSERDRIKHTIGNLTLITNKLNPSLSNGPWAKKKQGLQDHSTLFLNKILLSKFGDSSFSEKEIKERSQELAQQVCSIWPISE
ncbi:MAG: DUF262 domain-containing HNH endonuclease family protein [Anaerolineaceae bacterium]|nr:DUF262 domain-containing HNH endonuclease family protein [Anaerolineaceae bacterium]